MPVGERMRPKTSGVDREVGKNVGRVCTLGTYVDASQSSSERRGNGNAIIPGCLPGMRSRELIQLNIFFYFLRSTVVSYMYIVFQLVLITRPTTASDNDTLLPPPLLSILIDQSSQLELPWQSQLSLGQW
jgi:hypothetical protein